VDTERIREQFRRRLHAACAHLAGRPAAFWEEILFVLFCLSIVLFPFGQAFRVLPPLLCLPVLVLLYSKDWPNRTLPRLPVRWLFAGFFACIAFEVLASHWLALSWHTVRPNLLRGFLLPFVAIECVRNERDLRFLTGSFALAAAITGLCGVWQFAVGTDPFTGTAPYGGFTFEPGALASLRDFRLTGPLSTYRVGNYLALIGLPACGLFLLWPDKPVIRHRAVRLILTLCVLGPAVFLWIGAQARSGYLAAIGGLYATWVLFARPRLRIALLPPLIGLLLIAFGPERISLAHALADERRAIWHTAWQCFLAHPWFGTGAGTYPEACAALGITQLSTGNPVPPHPHNIYLQWLVDGGLSGFTVLFLCAAVLTVWSARTIRRGLRADPDRTMFWRLTAFFWAGWFGYLINGIAAHGFYRTWWIATSFSLLGILLGACARGSRHMEDS
jgi:O-antigen ligase